MFDRRYRDLFHLKRLILYYLFLMKIVPSCPPLGHHQNQQHPTGQQNYLSPPAPLLRPQRPVLHHEGSNCLKRGVDSLLSGTNKACRSPSSKAHLLLSVTDVIYATSITQSVYMEGVGPATPSLTPTRCVSLEQLQQRLICHHRSL